MAFRNLRQLLLQTLQQLETVEILGTFIGITALIFYIIHRIGKDHLEDEVHKAINLLISLVIALILIGLSTAIGFL
jgi:heme A synthase